jgi:terminase large subunit-like protein
MQPSIEYRVHLKKPHPQQERFLRSKAKRKVIRAGRRAGKTTGVAIIAVQSFLAARRVLYAAPTAEQIGQFWKEVKTPLADLIEARVFYKNESEHMIERIGTNQCIKAKTAWNADTLRGDYADLLILDEWQLMDETAWEDVGAPMLLDKNGEAIFVYTPPSIHSQALSRARDPRHAVKMYKKALAEQKATAAEGKASRWEAFHFRSQDNPHISEEALREITKDMSNLSYRQEILAEDIDEAPGALWTRALIENARVYEVPQLARVGVGVDPPGGASECGIVVAGVAQCSCKGTPEQHGFVLQDRSLRDAPDKWAKEVVAAYKTSRADRVFGEKNFGGDMVEATIRTVDPSISYKNVSASRSKAIRAEPISAFYEQGKIHHVGRFDALENEMASWQPGVSTWSPNRVDALVWVLMELMLGEGAYEAACFGSEDEEEREHGSIWDSGLDVRHGDRPRIERPGGSIWDRADDIGRGLFESF